MKLEKFRQQMLTDSEYVKAADELQLQFELANSVLRARLKKGWSQTDLANAVGTKQANISRIEAGLANPTITLIQKLINALDLEIKILLLSHTVFSKNAFVNSSYIPALNVYSVPNWPCPTCGPRYDIKSEDSIEEGRLE